MSGKKFFLTFEGTDGVGKSTHVGLLSAWFKKIGVRHIVTREPGGGRVSEKIRSLLLNPQYRMEPLTELMLYEAARVEHVNKIIRPALRKGMAVLCDRFADATEAYQGAARGIPLSQIRKLNRIATGGLTPDLTILLDLPAADGWRKAAIRRKNGTADRLESEGVRFQERVRRGYMAIHRRERRRVHRVPVLPSVHETQDLIRRIVKGRFSL